MGAAALAVAINFSCAAPRDVTIGPDKETGGNYWGQNVSRDFAEAQLKALYQVMNAPETKAEIRALACGRPAEDHVFSVTLWREGTYRERIVRLQMTPRLYVDDRCVQEAVNFVFQRNVIAMDAGPPIDYGYKDRLTRKPLGPLDDQSVVEAPTCPCTESLVTPNAQ